LNGKELTGHLLHGEVQRSPLSRNALFESDGRARPSNAQLPKASIRGTVIHNKDLQVAVRLRQDALTAGRK